jgi:DNA-binding CsgD family transcriptional regulator
MTEAESRLAVRLASGGSVAEAASKLGISYETARTTLKRIFPKVGVTRQSELTAVLAKLMLP